MPMYEYRCLSCGLEFEKLQHFSDPPLTTCEACGGAVKKLISQTSFILKGSGWYVTDYARKNQSAGRSNGAKSKAADSPGSGAAEKSSTSGSTAESKDKTGTAKKARSEAA